MYTTHAPLVSRVPSFYMFDAAWRNVAKARHLVLLLPTHVDTVQWPKMIDSQKAYYVLNPGGDLEATQETLTPFFKQYGWSGTTGEIPARDTIKDALTNQELFM